MGFCDGGQIMWDSHKAKYVFRVELLCRLNPKITIEINYGRDADMEQHPLAGWM